MGLFGYKIPSIPTISLCLHPYSHSDFFFLCCVLASFLFVPLSYFFFHFFLLFSSVDSFSPIL